MSLEHFFRDELTYLRLQGREFAKAHPELTRFLSEQTTDPDVERLLEGFAFLTGSLRAKIEDEFPELTHGLLGMLWPNYLRPVPSMTIMQFSVLPGAIAQPAFVARGCELDSLPIDDVVCHFQTCHDAWIYPADIREIKVQSGNDLSTITLDIGLHGPLSLSDLQLDKLRFYLGGDTYTAYELYFWIASQLSHIELEIDGQRFRQEASVLKTVGFEREDALLPYPGNVYSGYRILQEYFCFPESFLFFQLAGAVWPDLPLTVTEFRLHFCFDRPLPAELKIRPDSFMLNCVPAINLFQHDSEPINLSGRQTDYPLKASYRNADSFEIFSVDKVEGWVEGNSGRARGIPRTYQPFESFQHQIERAKGRLALYYRIRVREAVNGNGFDHMLSFVRGDEQEVIDLDESISVTLTCTNRSRAAQLPVGAICVPTGNSPSFATFRNLVRPTRPLRPAMDGSLHWTLISNLSLNYVSLLRRDALVQILRTYDFPALHDKQAEQASRKRLAGIESIETTPIDRLVQGMPVRGLKSILSVRQSAFSSEGELYLFSTVLAHFFSLYASVNAFHLLEVVNIDNKERYRWPVQIGQHSMM
ncbi:type VI secretion system baseplate subunit TssF [Pectobacterium aroidearum]|jgi:type VI secretion system protein ImpG|uniref:Type VI secretion system baseplate subunit TssF n=1 Tax=Pectobacterium aroidearum TaxID=1201031 RepID=A0AAW3T0H3_9GAMM|nr:MULTISPECIES: type VI secretion system baseplate subunit TssF [Pectobacterium]UKE84758.1 type VI secretion system baseplate subunit TssF [Pectobacterium sp. PL152]MBA0206279.1 type VI secretion system baseplate subunit TssF [Pectobacterium aroidearum]MBA5201491.1 type VI secretion system baseplate subunit TssF [Pectobacterium aroidearum]MBA5205965.1 type VI secretion system baseplate subunit TssF [Pectobacterium aroidearum]MBA5229767.1 type VI secretion system baseplate subunit TssF [Pectob